MSINHLKGHILQPAMLMDQKKSEVSQFAGKTIKAVNTSHDSPSTSSNMLIYKDFISQALLSKIKVTPTFVENCSANLDVAIKNNAEKKETRAKCSMVKMLLEGNSLERVLACRESICRTYQANVRIQNKESLALMLEYYLVGGVKLLRGFPCTAHSTLYPASAMNFILTLFEKNPELLPSGFKINTEIKKRIENAEHVDGMDAETIPSPSVIESFIAHCGYKKDWKNQWFFSHELAESSGNLVGLSKLQQIEIEQNILTSAKSEDSVCNLRSSIVHLIPAMLANLEAAIENDVEKEKDKFKFTAVKSLLVGFTYKQTLKQCHKLYSNIQRSITWSPERLDLLLHNYLLGGLQFLRAFSFKSHLTISQLKTMSYIMELVEAEPAKGSAGILSIFKHMKSMGLISVDDVSSYLPNNSSLDRFIIRCGYKRIAGKWILHSELTPNIHFDGLPQAQIFDKQPSLKYDVKSYDQLMNSARSIASSTAIVQDISSSMVPFKQGAESAKNNHQNSLTEKNKTKDSKTRAELLELFTQIPQTMPFDSAFLAVEQRPEQVEAINVDSSGLVVESFSSHLLGNKKNLPEDNIVANKVTTLLFDEKMVAHEKVLEANALGTDQNSSAELSRLMLSFESLSSCSSKYSLEEISEHIENSTPNLFESQLDAIQNIPIHANTEKRQELNSNEIILSSHTDGRGLFELLTECDQQEGSAFQLGNIQNVNIDANTEKTEEICSNEIILSSLRINNEDFLDPSYPSYPQEMQAIVPSVSDALSFAYKALDYNSENESAVELQPSVLEKLPINNRRFLAENPALIMENEEREIAYEKPLTYFSIMPKDLSVKEQIDLLKIAIANDLESNINRIKFTAVKMFLEGEYSSKSIEKICNSLFINNRRNRQITWDQERLELLTRYYLNGGLAILRGFSFKSLPELASAETMGVIIRLVEEYPKKGSIAILKMVDQMNKMNNEYADMGTLILPFSTALDRFLVRCGYQRIQRQWVFNPALTASILPNDLREREVSNGASFMSKKAIKRHSSEKLQFFPHKRIRETSIESKIDSFNTGFLNQENSTLVKNFSANLQAAIDNDSESSADKIKFTAIKMLLDGYTYEEVLEHCNVKTTIQTKKNILWTQTKLDILLDHYLHGGLWLVRAFSFQSFCDTTLPKKMGFIMKLVNENPTKGSTALLSKINEMNEKGQIPEGIDVSSLPSDSTLDVFILRTGFQRIPKKRWVFKSHLTPNLFPDDLHTEQIIEQTDPNDLKTASKQGCSVKLKFH